MPVVVIRVRRRVESERPVSRELRLPRVRVKPTVAVWIVGFAHRKLLGRADHGIEHAGAHVRGAQPRCIGAGEDVVDADIFQMADDERFGHAGAFEFDQVLRFERTPVFELAEQFRAQSALTDLREFGFIKCRATSEDQRERKENSGRHAEGIEPFVVPVKGQNRKRIGKSE